MRVVGGIAGGIPLLTPRTDLRPTMEVVKNAIFNSLMESIPNARVLDLFAGGGGLGIEALSRGAAAVTFVESDRKAAAVIEKNLAKTRLQGASIETQDVFKWLARAPQRQFDIIIADPPYVKHKDDRDFVAELVASAEIPRVLVQGGIFVLEHMPNTALALEGRWECLRQKRYGATEVAFLKFIG
jgi:16S rRNA (guanine966-N2)-methyltransferase